MIQRFTPDCMSSDIFSGIGFKHCKEILAFSRRRTFARNEMLFSQGALVENLLVVESGQVKVTHASPEGDEVILWILGPGDTVDARISLDWHVCSAVAMENSTALVWESHRFSILSERYLQIRENLGTILSNRLHELETRFCELAHQTARQRLAKSLLRLVAPISSEHSSGVRLRVTQEELGQLTGLTSFTINRLLTQWVASGVLEQGRAALVIRSTSGLEQLSRVVPFEAPSLSPPISSLSCMPAGFSECAAEPRG